MQNIVGVFVCVVIKGEYMPLFTRIEEVPERRRAKSRGKRSPISANSSEELLPDVAMIQGIMQEDLSKIIWLLSIN